MADLFLSHYIFGIANPPGHGGKMAACSDEGLGQIATSLKKVPILPPLGWVIKDWVIKDV